MFNWWVVGTTIGGNAIVVGDDDPGVFFADHTWYFEDTVSYQDLAGDGTWIDLPLYLLFDSGILLCRLANRTR